MKQTDHMFALNFRVLSVFNPSKNITACQIWMKKNVIIAFCGWSLFTELGAKWNYQKLFLTYVGPIGASTVKWEEKCFYSEMYFSYILGNE